MNVIKQKHWLKIKDCYADRVESGEKTFEVRFNDRDYQVGDVISYRVVDNKGKDVKYHKLNGKEYVINYIHSGLGLEEHFVILGIVAIKYGEMKYEE